MRLGWHPYEVPADSCSKVVIGLDQRSYYEWHPVGVVKLRGRVCRVDRLCPRCYHKQQDTRRLC